MKLLLDTHLLLWAAGEPNRLPAIHKDPFDRILISQAKVEGITLLTTDSMVAQYPGPLQKM